MKRYIKANNYHLYDDPSLPSIPTFEDFKKVFNHPSKFGKEHKGRGGDIRMSGKWTCDLYGYDEFNKLTETGIKAVYYGSHELLDDVCFWYLIQGSNGWYGLCVFNEEDHTYNELGAADGFNECLLWCKPSIEAWLKECAYIKYNEGV